MPAVRPASRVFALSFLLWLACASGSIAGDWGAGLRLQETYGHDNNPLEWVPPLRPSGESFARTLLEAQLRRQKLPLRLRTELAVRALLEQYPQLPREARSQAELRLAFDLPGPARGGGSHLEAGLSTRAYPDSGARGFRRQWGRLSTQARIGPLGLLRPQVDVWSLDFLRTRRRDQTGGAFDLTYERPLRRWISASLGLELGTVHFGWPSLAEFGSGDQVRPDQSDSYRYAHVGLWVLHRALIRLQYGYRSQSSNSIGSSFKRHEIRWLLSSALPLGCNGQIYGNLEHNRYLDPQDLYYILRPGEIEAGDDNNLISVRISRPLGRQCSVDARCSWFRNESLLLQSYYQKRVIAAGLSWELGRVSDF